MAERQPIDILLVEDDENDILITKRAFTRHNLFNRLYVVRDGEEALDFIYHRGGYQDPESAPRPGLVLLDINMPKMNGIEVLRKLKSDPGYKVIPIVMLTTSKRDQDKIESYNLGVNSYIIKPVDFTKFVDAIATINLYWELNELP